MSERIFLDKRTAEESKNHALMYANEDAAVLNGILCVSSGAMYCYDRQENDLMHALHFKGQAIHHLKQQLNKSSRSDWRVSTAYAVSLLLWMEVRALYVHE